VPARVKPLEGTVTLNGKPLPRKYNRLAAYVMQDDILPQVLTPRELFTFAANMRLAEYGPRRQPWPARHA